MSAVAGMSPTLQVQSSDARISVVLEYLHTQPLDRLPNLRLIAAGLSLSESYLRHKFKATTSVSFREYVRRLRFQQARVYLENGIMNVKQARLEVGMLDHSSFAKGYKKYFGETPTRTRHRASTARCPLLLPPIFRDSIEMKQSA